MKSGTGRPSSQRLRRFAALRSRINRQRQSEIGRAAREGLGNAAAARFGRGGDAKRGERHPHRLPRGDAAPVDPVGDQDFIEIGHLAMFGHAGVEVEILGDVEARAIAADLAEGLCAHHRRRGDQAAAGALARADIAVPLRRPELAEAAAGAVDQLRRGPEQAGAGPFRHRGQLRREAPGMGDIVAIEPGEQRRPGGGGGMVQGGGELRAFEAQRTETRFAAGPSHEDVEGRIGAAIVHGDDLEVAEGLGDEAFQGLLEEARGVAHGHQHRDCGPALTGFGLRAIVGGVARH
jgi:hypothetical protein